MLTSSMSPGASCCCNALATDLVAWGTAAIGLAYLFLVAVTMSQNPAGGLLLLILGPVIAIIYLAFIRMTLEIYLAVVRMSEDIHQRLPRS